MKGVINMTLFEKALTAIVGGAAAVKGASMLFDKKKTDNATAPTAGETTTTTTVEATATEVKSEETPTEEKTEQ